jgi:non-ribosomal peptide synthetase component F
MARGAAKRAGVVGKPTIRVTRALKGGQRMYPGHHAVVRAGQAAFIMGQSGESVTYGELDVRTNRLAHLFRATGLRRLDSAGAQRIQRRIIDDIVPLVGSDLTHSQGGES